MYFCPSRRRCASVRRRAYISHFDICSDTTGPLEVERNCTRMMIVMPTTEIPILFYLEPLPPPHSGKVYSMQPPVWWTGVSTNDWYYNGHTLCSDPRRFVSTCL